MTLGTNAARQDGTGSAKIAVVGAGISGLACASYLLAHHPQFDVTILEARSRYGGRCHQVSIPRDIDKRDSTSILHTSASSSDILVDLGPNWIHAPGPDNPISCLATSTNTSVLPWPKHPSTWFTIDSKGRQLSYDEHRFFSKPAWRAFHRALRYSEHFAGTDKIPAWKTIKDQVEEEIQTEIRNDKSLEGKQQDMLNIVEHWTASVGEGIDQLSLRFAYLEEDLDEEDSEVSEENGEEGQVNDGIPDEEEEQEDVFVASTYRNILKEIARIPLHKARLLYNTEVVKIITSDPPPHYRDSTTNENKNKVVIHTNAGEISHFDEVVVTLPLAYLKHRLAESSLFSPPLPPRLSQAIGNFSFGRLEKCIVSFDSAWWHKQDALDEPTTHDDQGEEENDRPSMTPPPPTTTAPPLSFASFHAPTYHPFYTAAASNIYSRSSWPQELMKLSTLPGTTAHASLLFYVFGDTGAALLASLPDSLDAEKPVLRPRTELSDSSPSPFLSSSSAAERNNNGAAYAQLDALFRPLYAKLPHFSDDGEVCRPHAFVMSNWQGDTFTGGGSYTSILAAAEDAEADLEVLGSETHNRDLGIERGVWLAGEHTAGTEHFATTTGAFISGERAAKWICQKYQCDT